MRIDIDVDLDANGNVTATHFVETDRLPWNKCTHPKTGQLNVDVLDMIAFLSSDKSFMVSGGWNIPTKLPGYPKGTTRWQVLVQAVNGPTADVAVKALGLT